MAANPRFEVSFPKAAHPEAVTGMVYVAVSRENDRTPVEQTSTTGVPLFSTCIQALKPGIAAVIDGKSRSYPLASLRDLPAGKYWVQPFVNIYTRFPRADGKTVWLHMDQWEGQDWKRSPGNLFGTPVQITFNPKSSRPIRLVADKIIPPIQIPADTGMVKRIRIKSDILSKWWGQPIYLGATVLLPRDYALHPDVKFPVNYIHEHFTLEAPGGFGKGGDFDKLWLDNRTPRFLYVSLQHPSPYYDNSYGVNSENNGPYGDAILYELIPAIEKQFRAIAQPWARILTGGSTGGWIAVAHQVVHPDFFGGCFASCPDALDFTCHQIVNIYEDENAYHVHNEWMKVPRPNERKTDGNILSMMEDENHYELVVGDKSRSGGQWDIWEATYSPVGKDGYPQRIWDKSTGQIDRRVAEQWKKYDIRLILETNWAALGPKVADKLNIYVGDMDSYYLNNAVEKLNTFLSTADNPKFTGEIIFKRRAPHGWGQSAAELLEKMTRQIKKTAPPRADLEGWRY